MSVPDLDLLSSWQFQLPEQLIALRPAPERHDSRLLVVHRATGRLEHHRFRELPELLSAGDLLVFNNTRVLPARLFGIRTATGGRWEGLFIEECSPGVWRLLCETRGRPQPGESITVLPAGTGAASGPSSVPPLILTLERKNPDGSWQTTCHSSGPVLEQLECYGTLPLPPYMGRRMADEEDQRRYQTQFARVPGAVAAPTAGLHFSGKLLTDCRTRRIQTTELTLHVGIGTFRPVTTDRLSDHVMHHEWACLPDSAAASIRRTRLTGGKVVAVGTTSVRTLESAALEQPAMAGPWEGTTDLFIRPGFRFQAIDALVTNFHLPGSTLLALVAALAGYELIMDAYRLAIENRYRFYSYGDAMLIL